MGSSVLTEEASKLHFVGATDTSSALVSTDDDLRKLLISCSDGDPDFWSFKTDFRQKFTYFEYPARMIPKMQRRVLEVIRHLQPGIRSLLEPFAGSGTILIEALRAGLTFTAQDVNPLSILLCHVRCITHPDEIDEGCKEVVKRIARNRRTRVTVSFSNMHKWFRSDFIPELCAIRDSIRKITSLSARRFLWVALAETVRRTSNSRTSTYKLHVRTENEISALRHPIEVFLEVVRRNLELHKSYTRELAAYSSQRSTSDSMSQVILADSRNPISGKYDLVLTSPPYGDNQTTIPYGQQAYLPLQWLDLRDIDEGVTRDVLRSTYEIDGRSIGGKRPNLTRAWTLYDDILQKSQSLELTIRRLRDKWPVDRASRVLAFVRDLELSIGSIIRAMNKNAYMALTIGNRVVGGQEIPMQNILLELLAANGMLEVITLQRLIPQKRMARRNGISATIHHEHLLVARNPL